MQDWIVGLCIVLGICVGLLIGLGVYVHDAWVIRRTRARDEAVRRWEAGDR